jgi:hypothetical protein
MLEGYRSTPGHKLSVQILNKLESVSSTYVMAIKLLMTSNVYLQIKQVRQRGRKRDMIG